MSTNLPTSETSGSSPYISNHQYLDDEVERLAAQARLVEELDPVLNDVFITARLAFMDVFTQRIQLIKSRSQAFEDAHVTVYDKVLLALTENGDNLETPYAIAYFCEESLGICFAKGAHHAMQAISNAVRIQSAVNKEAYINGADNGSISAIENNDHGGFDVYFGSERTTTDEIELSQLPSNSSDEIALVSKDQHVTRLINLFHEAKAEYAIVAEERSENTAGAARFLRDTAENIIHALGEQDIDVKLWQDIKETYEIAKNVVVSMNGGKKRKFDRFIDIRSSEDSRRGEIKPMANGQQYYTSTKNNLGMGGGFVTTTRNHHSMNCRHISTDQNTFPEPIKAMTYRNKCRRLHTYDFVRSVHGRDDKNVIKPRRGDQDEKVKKKRQPKGRGPSGIPFGYSRPVDSWHPPK